MNIQISKKVTLLFSSCLLLLASQAFGTLTVDNKSSYNIYLKKVPMKVPYALTYYLDFRDPKEFFSETKPLGPGQTSTDNNIIIAYNSNKSPTMPYELFVAKKDQKPQQFALGLAQDSEIVFDNCKIKITVARDKHNQIKGYDYQYENVTLTIHKEECQK